MLKFCPQSRSSDLVMVPAGELSGYRHYCWECATWVSVEICNCKGAIVVSIRVSRTVGGGKSAIDKQRISQLDF